MKEVRYFYVPDAAVAHELPADEASHAVRVLRLSAGDEMMLMDGQGCFYRAVVTVASNHHCMYDVLEVLPQQRPWQACSPCHRPHETDGPYGMDGGESCGDRG